MSGNKIIVRPKVRFSQFSDSEKRCQGEDSKIACKDATTARKQAKGPKIRSIVPFKKHVRIMAPEKSTGTTDRNVRLSDREIEISTSSDTSPEDVQKTSVLKDNVSRIESSKILRNANDIKDTKEPCKTSDKGIHARSSSLKDHGTSLQQKGKENKDMAVKTVSTKNVVKTGIDTRSVSRSAPHKKLDNSRSDVNVRTLGTADPKISNATRSRSVSSRMSKASALGAKSDVMPCYRRLQIARTKSKTSQVKKLVLYDTTSGRTRTFVGPGVSRGRQNDATAVDKTGRSVSPDVAADKLARPSCNSIMCVIEKLNKLELQRIVTDVEHLPPVQKNLVNGKVSAALDFTLNELVFKDLVDLTVDEDQLPQTLTRSKDPEPRQKDIAPKLSEFFVPEDTEEICVAVSIKPRAPECVQNWNVHKISDKIFDWRHSLDNV